MKVMFVDKYMSEYTQAYVDRYPWMFVDKEIEFKEGEFTDTLQFVGEEHRRSGSGALMTDSEGYHYVMLPTDFFEIIPLLERGIIKGTFKYVKKGSALGIQYVK